MLRTLYRYGTGPLLYIRFLSLTRNQGCIGGFLQYYRFSSLHRMVSCSFKNRAVKGMPFLTFMLAKLFSV